MVAHIAYGQRKWETSVRNQNFYSSIKTSRTYETRYLFITEENPNLCHNEKLLAKKLHGMENFDAQYFLDPSPFLCAIEMAYILSAVMSECGVRLSELFANLIEKTQNRICSIIT